VAYVKVQSQHFQVRRKTKRSVLYKGIFPTVKGDPMKTSEQLVLG